MKYQKGEGWVELAWWPDLLRHLVDLKAQFHDLPTPAGQRCARPTRGKLLELLTRFQSTGMAEYTIEDFCASMEATEKQAANFAKIRTKIIEPSGEGTHRKRRLADSVASSQSRPKSEGRSLHLHAQSTRACSMNKPLEYT